MLRFGAQATSVFFLSYYQKEKKNSIFFSSVKTKITWAAELLN